jgi:hypothetical protein
MSWTACASSARKPSAASPVDDHVVRGRII